MRNTGKLEAVVFCEGVRSNAPIPGLAYDMNATSTGSGFDVVFGALPDWAARDDWTCRYQGPAERFGLPNVVLDALHDETAFRFRYADGTAFIIEPPARVWATWQPDSSIEDAATYLLGNVFAFLMRLRGHAILHAAVVETEEGAVAFAGPSGAGKSVITAAFATAGARVLTDDVTVLEIRPDGVWVRPAYPRIKLWADAAEQFANLGMARLTPNWDKLCTDADRVWSYQSEARRLTGIYILQDRTDADVAFTSDLTGHAALLALVANSYTPELLDIAQRARELSVFTALAKQAGIRRLALPNDYDSVAAFSREFMLQNT